MRCYPDYYNEFKCIADKCVHNCCIGWEIDIDDQTLGFYSTVTGALKERLRQHICTDGTPHFVLLENDRCPFLNSQNLCDIISHLGEDHLCDICAQHPRFHCELPDRVESGLGLCCEQAARIILNKQSKTTLVCDSNCVTDDEIIILRDKVIDCLQNRSHSISTRIGDMLQLCNTTLCNKSTSEWCDILLSLERLDSKWTLLLEELKSHNETLDYDAFDSYMALRQHEHEQFLVYLIYRHFASSPDIFEAGKRAAFAAFSHSLIRSLSAMLLHKNHEFTTEDHVELVRLFSSEIEYCDENIHALFDIV